MRGILLVILMFVCTGCSLRSRYALNDTEYAAKYFDGAEKGDIGGKLKQAFDARHTKYLQGWLLSGGAQVQPGSGETFASVDFGRELYRENFLTSRLGVSSLLGNDLYTIGVDGGFRLQSPTRIAPFVGVGASAGLQVEDAAVALAGAALTLADIDNDGIGSALRDLNDDDREVAGLATFYPEVGVHFWLDGRIRVSTFGRYLITSEGGSLDDWLIGCQIALFSR